MFFTKPTMVDARVALRGREFPVLDFPVYHEVFGLPIEKVPPGAEVAYVALGCFWGAEKLFWNTPGVVNTAVGYQGGYTPNPTYDEVCSGRTGHTEAVKVVFDPARVSYEQLLRVFYENHDPTQGFRQGNDRGTQYRSALYTLTDEQAATAQRLTAEYQAAFAKAGYPGITTEIAPAGPFFLAEGYHQQYLEKNPRGYCPIHATGVTCNPS
ncbi:MAG: peptide-methionine (S)-S-oxide reductase MsrA [Micropruina sp.]|nr:peptide-methionine (S)-S-oxide reductase MsrA [Micropruina sp.]